MCIAPIAVKDHPGRGVATGDGHRERIGDQAGAHVLSQLPADHHPGGQIDHRGQVQPPFAGAQVRDVPDQPLPRQRRVEVTLDQIRALDRLLTGDRGGPDSLW
jgi:hypothetical protein